MLLAGLSSALRQGFAQQLVLTASSLPPPPHHHGSGAPGMELVFCVHDEIGVIGDNGRTGYMSVGNRNAWPLSHHAVRGGCFWAFQPREPSARAEMGGMKRGWEVGEARAPLAVTSNMTLLPARPCLVMNQCLSCRLVKRLISSMTSRSLTETECLSDQSSRTTRSPSKPQIPANRSFPPRRTRHLQSYCSTVARQATGPRVGAESAWCCSQTWPGRRGFFLWAPPRERGRPSGTHSFGACGLAWFEVVVPAGWSMCG